MLSVRSMQFREGSNSFCLKGTCHLKQDAPSSFLFGILSGISYIGMLWTKYNEPFCSRNFIENSLMLRVSSKMVMKTKL